MDWWHNVHFKVSLSMECWCTATDCFERLNTWPALLCACSAVALDEASLRCASLKSFNRFCSSRSSCWCRCSFSFAFLFWMETSSASSRNSFRFVLISRIWRNASFATDSISLTSFTALRAFRIRSNANASKASSLSIVIARTFSSNVSFHRLYSLSVSKNLDLVRWT